MYSRCLSIRARRARVEKRPGDAAAAVAGDAAVPTLLPDAAAGAHNAVTCSCTAPRMSCLQWQTDYY